jgi:hypothetical protein
MTEKRRGRPPKAATAPVSTDLVEPVQSEPEQQPLPEPPVAPEPVEQANPLKITVKNSGKYDVFEPATLRKIRAGQTADIICISEMQLRQALINLKQLAAFNKRLEVIHNAGI